MRLEAIERPDGLKMKLAYKFCKRRLGKVITPLKVVYARVPGMLRMGMAASAFLEKGNSLDDELQFLLQTHTAQLNKCMFCVDIARAMALQGEMSLDKVNALDDYAGSALFSAGEKAALRYVEEATVAKKVSDETFAEMKANFSDSEIAEITVVNAIENFYNMINIPLEIESDGLCALVPGLGARDTTLATTR